MNGSAANKRPRQERARDRLEGRITFWQTALTMEITEVDGRPVDPAKKLALAEQEQANLAKKGVK